MMGAYELHQTAKWILLEAFQTPLGTLDWDENILREMERLGITYPHRLQFADTNWSGWFFWICLQSVHGTDGVMEAEPGRNTRVSDERLEAVALSR